MEPKRCYGCMQPRDEGRFCQNCGFDYETPNASHQLPTGTVLKDQYLVGKVLGQGGFGITYLGWDLYLNIPVAIKEYYPTGAVMRESTHGLAVTNCEGRTGSTFENNRRRFLREAQSLAQLSNVPEVVQVRNFFSENETAYIVMEYIDGVTLKDYLKSHGLMAPNQALETLRPVMEGLKKVHDVGLVHRDISPDNIMLLPDGRIKLLDFGAVRDTDSESAMRSTQAILKPGFAPIEQYKSRGELGPWTDIYALCGTVFYCITGRVPMDAPERAMDQRGIGWEQIPGLSQAQIYALNQGTALFPQNRLQSVQELMRLLNTDPLPVTDIPYSDRSGEPKRNHAAVPVPPQPEMVSPSRYDHSMEQPHTVPLRSSSMAEQFNYTAPVVRDQPLAQEDHYTAPVMPEAQQTVPAQQQTPAQQPKPKKKLIPVLIGLAVLLVILVVLFFTAHIWKDATCTSPRTCLLCGETEGKALGHKWTDPSCEEPSVCKNCGEIGEDARGHSWVDATCLEPKTCLECGATEGKVSGHVWKNATCTAPKTCTACGITEGKAQGHSWKNATCTEAKTCTVCNKKDGQPLGHSWKAATVDKPKTCSRCNATEGKALGYIEEVSGSFESFRWDNSNTHALVFDTPLKNCTGLTLNFEPEFKSNTYVGEWKFLYRDGSGKWHVYDSFSLASDGTASVTYKFSSRMNISAVAVIPMKSGSYSYSFYLWITKAYVS